MATDPLSKSFRETLNDPHRVEEIARQYRNAKPYPHVVIDGMLSGDWLSRTISEWPHPSHRGWGKLEKGVYSQWKRGAFDVRVVPERIRVVLGILNSGWFLEFLKEVTGVSGLFGDSRFRGAGLHETSKGGFLKRHVDFNRLPEDKGNPTLEDPYRRVNLFLYLNPGWKDEWNGHLCLWKDKTTPDPEVEIAPLANRLVIAEASDRSWHGHEKELNCPKGMTRRSLAAYYYSSRPGEHYKKRHSTVYVKAKKPPKQG